MVLGNRSVLIRKFGLNPRCHGYHITSGTSAKSFVRMLQSEGPKQQCPITLSRSISGAQQGRCFSGGWSATRGHDITSDSLEWGNKPKINITGYGESGFNVKNMMKLLDPRTESDTDGTVHMNGSMIVFPNAAFLWSVEEPEDVTVESLSSILLYRPKLDYLFIGCDGGYGSIAQLTAIQNHMRLHGVVVEQMMLHNAIGPHPGSRDGQTVSRE